MSFRKIAIVTGSRAEYGILSTLIGLIQNDSDLELQLLVTGSHLEEKYGLTKTEILNDGFPITAEIPMDLKSDQRSDLSSSLALGLNGFSEVLNELRPDLLIVLGDRFELLAPVQAAFFLEIPIAHIHGGEVTQGAMDDSIRHVLTKFSHLHFTSTEKYRNRILQLGESEKRVFCVGAPGLDLVAHTKLLAKEDLLSEFNLNKDNPYFLITYHPETAGDQNTQKNIEQLANTLDQFQNYSQIISLPNADPGSASILRFWNEFAKTRPHVYLVQNLGHLRYLSLLKHAKAVIGNSSSGIIEAPFFGTATLNIGNRQKGRLSDVSVFHCQAEEREMTSTLRILIQKEFTSSFMYGDGHASEKIWGILKNFKRDHLLMKEFVDRE